MDDLENVWQMKCKGDTSHAGYKLQIGLSWATMVTASLIC